MKNKLGNFKIFHKNPPKIVVKSGWCPRRFCPGGVLLTEFETSPLQVIWTLRLGAALWSFKMVFWEAETLENQEFIIFIISMISGSLITDSTYREKWYPEYFNLNEALHVPRLNISSDWNSRLLENEFRDFEKSWKFDLKGTNSSVSKKRPTSPAVHPNYSLKSTAKA